MGDRFQVTITLHYPDSDTALRFSEWPDKKNDEEELFPWFSCLCINPDGNFRDKG